MGDPRGDRRRRSLADPQGAARQRPPARRLAAQRPRYLSSGAPPLTCPPRTAAGTSATGGPALQNTAMCPGRQVSVPSPHHLHMFSIAPPQPRVAVSDTSQGPQGGICRMVQLWHAGAFLLTRTSVRKRGDHRAGFRSEELCRYRVSGVRVETIRGTPRPRGN